MTTQDIIDEINGLVDGELKVANVMERVYFLTGELRKLSDGHRACQSLIYLLERNLEIEFGAPGVLIHTLEYFSGHYEELLLHSLEKQPALLTLCMLDRIINAELHAQQKEEYLKLMFRCTTHPSASDVVKKEALDFYMAHTAT